MLNGLGELQRILLLGCKSDLALSILEQLPIADDAEIILCGRNLNDFSPPEFLSKWLVGMIDIDFTNLERSKGVVKDLFGSGDIDLAIVAYATLGDEEHQLETKLFEDVLYNNFFSQAVLLNAINSKMLRQMHGQILLISSVAGMRPRRRNFVYGTSKFGVDFIAQGLQKYNLDRNVYITILRPGFVLTKMTAGLKSAPFSTNRTHVGEITRKALHQKRRVVYAPRYLSFVVFILKLIPERIYRILDK